MQARQAGSVQASTAEIVLYCGTVMVSAVVAGTLFSWKPAGSVLRGFDEVLSVLENLFFGG